MKRVLVITNLTCFGRENLIPTVEVLSAFDLEVSVLPTAIVSTVRGIDNKVVLDLTENMPMIINHFKEEHITFDCIYSGFISERKQADYILECKEYLLNEGGLFIVDPKMGKNGKLYDGLDTDIVMAQMNVTSSCDYVLPNITEAMMLTNNSKYEDIQDDYYINELIADLYRNGAKNVVLTGVQDDEYSSGAIGYDGLTKTTVLKEKMEGEFKGTGDIFKAYIVGGLVTDIPIKEILDNATDLIMDSIEETFNEENPKSLRFEDTLPKYTHKKKNPGWE